jgi:hypothetical protein
MVSTAGWTTAARWPLITTRSARYPLSPPIAERAQIGGSVRALTR